MQQYQDININRDININDKKIENKDSFPINWKELSSNPKGIKSLKENTIN
jgi:hypothetical protein